MRDRQKWLCRTRIRISSMRITPLCLISRPRKTSNSKCFTERRSRLNKKLHLKTPFSLLICVVRPRANFLILTNPTTLAGLLSSRTSDGTKWQSRLNNSPTKKNSNLINKPSNSFLTLNSTKCLTTYLHTRNWLTSQLKWWGCRTIQLYMRLLLLKEMRTTRVMKILNTPRAPSRNLADTKRESNCNLLERRNYKRTQN